jgi:hypothetical protein
MRAPCESTSATTAGSVPSASRASWNRWGMVSMARWSRNGMPKERVFHSPLPSQAKTHTPCVLSSYSRS